MVETSVPISATEMRNAASAAIDSFSPLEIVRLMNAEDQRDQCRRERGTGDSPAPLT